MLNIILSGNFAFLNHLTIIPALACLDDACWPTWLRRSVAPIRPTIGGGHGFQGRYILRRLVDFYLLWLIGNLSLPVVENLLQIGGKRQQMNASFGSFRLVNTYGAFGSVGQSRYEPIVSISYNGQEWIELEFPCKPGNVTRRPCFCAPYHYRLDWNIWFLGFKPHQRMLRQRETWMVDLLSKLLDERISARPWLDLLDTKTTALLLHNYNKETFPKYARVDMFHYEMAAPLWKLLPEYVMGNAVAWWNRSFEETLIVPVAFDMGHNQLVPAHLPS